MTQSRDLFRRVAPNADIALVALLIFHLPALALAVGALLDLFAIRWPARLTIVINVALCIAAAKTFAFYPVGRKETQYRLATRRYHKTLSLRE